VDLAPSIPEAQRWLQQAKSDLQAAHSDVRHSCPNWVLFKVHQALEKALVAAVLSLGEASRVPAELMEVARQLDTAEPELQGLEEEVGWLCGQGMDGKATQYPCYHPFPITPDQAFRSLEEEEVLKWGQRMLERLEKHVGSM
ncbi:SACS protein, partial [Upupa epops]|nr:SACS protein [Upupa epops]